MWQRNDTAIHGTIIQVFNTGGMSVRLIIDGKEWRHDENLSRSEVLNALREDLAWNDRVILEMLSGDEALSEEDFLTVPEDIEVSITSASEYSVGLAVVDEMKSELVSLLRETEQQQPDSALMTSRLQWLNDAATLLFETYPEIEPLEEEFQATVNWLLELLSASDWFDVARGDFVEALERLTAQVEQYGEDLRAMDEWNDEDEANEFDDSAWLGEDTPNHWNLGTEPSEEGEKH